MRLAVAASKFTPGIDSTRHDVPVAFRQYDLRDALNYIYPTDAHCVQYILEGYSAQPRINKAGLAEVESAGLTVTAYTLIADLDLPEHRPWPDDASAIQAARDLQTANPTCGVYVTRGGLRIVQPLTNPIAATAIESVRPTWLKSLKVNGPAALDVSTNDWTRLFRMPNVRRDGVAYISPAILIDGMTPIAPPRPVNRLERAALRLAKIHPAIEGQIAPGGKFTGGTHTFATAVEIVRGFDLTDAEAFQVMAPWAAQCVPPWTEEALRRKIREAREKGELPVGALLEASNPTREQVNAFATSLRRRKDPQARDVARMLQSIVRGEAYTAGNRDAAITLLARALAEEFPSSDPAYWSRFFAVSHGLMGDDRIPDIAKAFETASHTPVPTSLPTRRKHIAWVHRSERTDFYTPAEWAEYSARGANPPILRWRGQYFFLVPDGYSEPLDSRGAEIAFRQFLAPIQWIDFERNGNPVKFSTIFHEYGRTVANYAYSYVSTKSYYNPLTNTLIRPCAPLRPIQAKFHAGIDQWLRLAFRGTELEAVFRYFTFLPDLEHALAALFVTGPANSGKSLLAELCARLWHEAGPVRLGSVLATAYNDDAKRSPFFHGDEGIPDDARGRNATEYMRDLIARSVQPLNEKFVPQCYIEGHIRLMISANSTSSFRLTHSHGEDDVTAVAERFVHVHMHPESAAYLRDHGDEIHEWVSSDAGTAHILWIREKMIEIGTRREGRFGIPSTLGRPLAPTIFYTSGVRGRVLEWIVTLMRKPHNVGNPPFNPVRRDGVYITPIQLLSAIGMVPSLTKDLYTEMQASAALAGIADRVEGGYYKIRPEALRIVADVLNVDVDTSLASAVSN